MAEVDILNKLSESSPAILFGLALILLVFRADGIIQAVRALVQTWNDGQKEREDALAQLQTQTIKATNDAFEKAMQSVTKAMADSREFYVSRLEDAMKGNRMLEEEIQDLKDQLKEKEKRIGELETQVKQLTESLLAVSNKQEKNDNAQKRTARRASHAGAGL